VGPLRRRVLDLHAGRSSFSERRRVSISDLDYLSGPRLEAGVTQDLRAPGLVLAAWARALDIGWAGSAPPSPRRKRPCADALSQPCYAASDARSCGTVRAARERSE
jgi:hypothetical protein